MPSQTLCMRSVSPRSTLPRAAPRRRTTHVTHETVVRASKNAESTPRLPTTPRSGASTVATSGSGAGSDRTPHASASDLLERESTSLTSSLYREETTDGEDCQGNGVGGASTSATLPPLFRCVTGSKAKRIRFYRNGDKYFKGMWYAMPPERIRSWKALLEELTRALSDSVCLPHGVRHIFSLDGSTRITSLQELEDGESYVCSSSETYKKVDYTKAREPLWCFALPKFSSPQETAALALASDVTSIAEPNDFVYPRIVTVIRAGVRPRRVIRHLLNKRTARSFQQVLRDLTAVVKLDSGAIRRLFTLHGRPVTQLAEFFKEDDVFIAYGTERMGADDFYVKSDEFSRVYAGRFLRDRVGQGGPAGVTGVRRSRRVMPARNESLREDRCGSVIPDSELSRTLPLLLDDRMMILRLLGDGNTALVYETRDKDEPYARKALKVIARENTVGKEELIESEIAILSRIAHEHVVQLYHHWKFDGSWYLSMELIPGGDLFEHLCTVRRMSERDAARLTECLGKALHYLHSEGIVHRDVKPENLLIYHNPAGRVQLKLADFGLATHLPRSGEEMLRVICGTPTYVAAEVLAETGYDEKVDVWAAGVILYVMLCGFPPFQSAAGEQEALFAQILRGRVSFPTPAWSAVSAAAKALILCLLHLQVEERFSAADLLDNQWIRMEGAVEADYEAMAELAVETRLMEQGPEDDGDEEEDGADEDRNLYYSRRTSMDELSECSYSRRDSSFEFSRIERQFGSGN